MTFRDLLKTKSLRFWVAASMAIALVPLAASAVGGYLLLNHGVIAAIRDVASRQRDELLPAEHLRLLIMDAVAPVDEYVDGGDGTRPLTYRALRERIETEFARLSSHFAGEPTVRSLLTRARDSWSAADRDGTDLLSGPSRPGDTTALEMMERFHGRIAAATDTLSAALDLLDADIEADHRDALLFYERSMWISGIAAAISLVMAIIGILLIGRIIASSVDRLVDGASRFAEGEREHRIDVSVPPELHRVAEEFNRMAGRIRQSEQLLSDLARRDGLTRLLNRRAFDEAMAGAAERARATGEGTGLVILDIDHFKHINDTYGHAAGDETLRSIADVFASHLRPLDKAFRTGGEEFAVLLADADAPAAAGLADRLRTAVKARQFRVGNFDITVTISAGVAIASGPFDPAALNRAADAALYRAKTEGRDRVAVDAGPGTSKQSAA